MHIAAFASLLAGGPKTSHDSVVGIGEFLRGDEGILVCHLAERLRAPKADLLGRITRILTEDTMRLWAVVYALGTRRPAP
jgi:hypothetical protein